MASRDKKSAKPSTSRAGGIRTLSDLNRPTADSDSDSDGPQEYYTGGEKRSSFFLFPLKTLTFCFSWFNFQLRLFFFSFSIIMLLESDRSFYF